MAPILHGRRPWCNKVERACGGGDPPDMTTRAWGEAKKALTGAGGIERARRFEGCRQMQTMLDGAARAGRTGCGDLGCDTRMWKDQSCDGSDRSKGVRPNEKANRRPTAR